MEQRENDADVERVVRGPDPNPRRYGLGPALRTREAELAPRNAAKPEREPAEQEHRQLRLGDDAGRLQRKEEQYDAQLDDRQQPALAQQSTDPVTPADERCG